jgi:hypothetical protein
MGDSLKIGKTAASAAKATGIVAPVADAPVPESSTLVLVPPAPAAVVEEPQATNAIKLDAATLAKLDRLVAEYVVAIPSSTSRTPSSSRASRTSGLSATTISRRQPSLPRACSIRPVGSMQKGGLAVTKTVSTSLLQLRRQIEALDPSRQGDLFGTRKLLGVIPFGDRLRNYFARYQSSQNHINAIVSGLERPGGARQGQRRTSSARRRTCGRRWSVCVSTSISPRSSTPA